MKKVSRMKATCDARRRVFGDSCGLKSLLNVANATLAHICMQRCCSSQRLPDQRWYEQLVSDRA